MKFYLYICFFFLLPCKALAQNKDIYKLLVRGNILPKNIKNILIVTSYEENIDTVKVPSNNFEIKLLFGKEYFVNFLANGYSQKKLKFNTSVPRGYKTENYIFNTEIKLEKSLPGIEKRLLDFHYAEILFDKKEVQFVIDEEYNITLNERLKLLEEQKELRKKQLYSKAIEKGDSLLKKRDIDGAKKLYKEALLYDSDTKKLKNRFDKLILLEARIKALGKLYYEALAKAEMAFSEGDYARAKEAYLKAKRLSPADSYVIERLNEIRKIESGDEDPSSINKGSAFEGFIKLGDHAMKSKNFDKARTYYLKAKETNPKSNVPLLKINELNTEINKAFVDLEKSKGAMLSEANKLFEVNKFLEARDIYIKLIDLNFQRNFAIKRIKAIDKKLENKEKQSLPINPDDRFHYLLKKGDSCLVYRKKESAIDFYSLALEIYPASGQTKLKIEYCLDSLPSNSPNLLIKYAKNNWVENAGFLKGSSLPIYTKRLKEPYARIELIIKTTNLKTVVYKKIALSWGGVFYFRDHKIISPKEYEKIIVPLRD